MARTTNKAEDLLTFSRASSGTALTKVAYGPELVTNGGFDTDTTGWSSSGTATLSALSGELLVTNNGVTYGYARQDITTVIGETYEVTATVRRGTASQAYVQVGPVTSGSLLNLTTFSTTDVVLTGVFTATATTTNINTLNGNTNNGTAYFNNISVRKVTYNSPTGTLKLISHPTNKPRVEYDVNGVAKGLLIEEARTNLVADSLVFTSAPGAQGITVTSSSETAPDGTTSASLCTATGTAIHRVRNSVTVTASGVTYSTSVFVKNVDADYIQIHNSGDLQYYANFDLVNGVVGTTGSKTTSTITAYPNGWYRITASYDGTGVMNAVSNITIITSASAGFGENANKPGTQVHMWGVQREQGSFATSYIPTRGATATRSADIASIGVDKFGYNQAQGSVVVDFEIKGIDTNWYPHLFEFSDLTTANRLQAYHHFNGGRVAQGFSGGATQFSFTNIGSLSTNTTQKWALGVKQNDFFVAATGNQTASDTSGAMPVSISKLNIGTSYTSSSQLNGYMKSIKYYPTRLSDEELEDLALTKYANVYDLLKAQTAATLFDIDDTTSLRIGRDGSGIPGDGDPVGLMMDVSKTGGSTMSSYLSSATELVTNGTFDSDISGWSLGGTAGAGDLIQWNAGVLEVTRTTNNISAYQAISTTIGSAYRVVLGNVSDSFSRLSVGTSTAIPPDQLIGAGELIFVATATTHYIHLRSAAIATQTFDNISVKKLPGYVATAPSDAARPTLRAFNSPIDSRDVLTTTFGWTITDGGRA